MPRLEGPRQEGPSALGLRWSRGREEVCRRAGLGPRLQAWGPGSHGLLSAPSAALQPPRVGPMLRL